MPNAPLSLHRPRLLALVVALAAAFGLISATSADASHFRGGNLSWVETSSHNADFTYTASFRRSSYGSPAVGDIITENTGGTNLAFGDGAATGTLRYLVTSINPSEDWLEGIALEPGSNTDTLVSHNYSGFGGSDPDNFTAFSNSCCTIAALNNNANTNYGLQTQLKFLLNNDSPVSGLPPIVGLGDDGVQTFNVPAADNDVSPGPNHFFFRLPSSAECGGCASAAPPGLTIDPNTGQVSWDTSSVALGLWYHSYVIEERNAANNVVSSTMVAGLIRVSDTATNEAPVWNSPPTPADGTVFNVSPGNNVSFNLQATDPDGGDTVIISGSGIPPGATFTPTNGNPATGSFSWTPGGGDVGSYVLNFTPTDNNSLSGPFRTFTINVGANEGPAGDPTCSDGVDNDGDGQIDGADTGCTGGGGGGGGGGKCLGLDPTVSGNTGTGGPDVIVGTNGPDTIDGKGGDDTICARAGNDTVKGGGGNDTVLGESDNDTIGGQAGVDDLSGGGGSDELKGFAGDDEASGGNGVDTLLGNEGVDTLFGRGGNDVIRGNEDDDHMFGGTEDDNLRGGDGIDDAHGDAGTDSCEAETEIDCES